MYQTNFHIYINYACFVHFNYFGQLLQMEVELLLMEVHLLQLDSIGQPSNVTNVTCLDIYSVSACGKLSIVHVELRKYRVISPLQHT